MSVRAAAGAATLTRHGLIAHDHHWRRDAMQFTVRRIFCTALLGLLSLSSPAFAADTATGGASPVGIWKTIDDKTGKVVQVSEVNGQLEGKVEKVFSPPAESENPICDKCEGERKDKPVIGMTILWGLKKDGDEYKGGHILDPAEGKTYKCKIKVTDGGKALNVRGFIGFALIGRTQTWVRE
jgi:uncharacterized protein (DUF2147 family)